MLPRLDILAAEPSGAVDRVDQLRAGYLLNFIKFVEWPAAAEPQGRVLCFVGGVGIREAIAGAQSRQRSGASITTRVLSKGESAAGCQLLYVEAEVGSAPDTSGQPVLTVSDAPDFARHGGMVELFSEGNRLRFNINLEVARRAGLRISSSLLQLASHVEESGR